jgi:hypothetical protein
LLSRGRGLNLYRGFESSLSAINMTRQKVNVVVHREAGLAESRADLLDVYSAFDEV